jgi:transposase InsO family protein
MVAFIDTHRTSYGVEPICRVLPIAPSTYIRCKAEQRDPTKRSARAQQDDVRRAIIRRIWQENQQVYGPRKAWKQMGRERLRAARCRVRRLMRDMGLAGAVRGRAWITTTQSGSGSQTAGLVHHSDRGTQYLSMRDTDRLADAGIAPSVGSRGDSYDNALAESVIGLFKTEVIRRKGPWKHLDAAEFATLEWVDWFNHRRLLGPIGYVPPEEARYDEQAAVA